MTWLDNPVARMWGPYFLVLYALVFTVLFALSWWHRSRADESMELGDLPIPLKIDPYQFAYLRGGLLEVLRLATVDLYQRGLIVDSMPDSSGAKRLHLLPEADLSWLASPLRAVANFYRTPRQATELLNSGLTVGFSERIASWNRWIKSERLRHSTGKRTSDRVFEIILPAAFVSLGIYKLLVQTVGDAHVWPNELRHEQAFAHLLEQWFSLPYAEALAAAHKIGQYGILVAGVAVEAFFGTCVLIATAQLHGFTERGRRFINNLHTAFARLKRPQSVVSATSNVSQTDEEPDYAVPVLAMGLFGVAALQGGPLDILFEQYEKSTEAGSACGVGCGSSCGSGDGGGGCGGGGCGCGGE